MIYEKLNYTGKNGQALQLRFEPYRRRGVWFFSFGKALEFGPFKSKFDAMLQASWKCGYSMRAIDWN